MAWIGWPGRRAASRPQKAGVAVEAALDQHRAGGLELVQHDVDGERRVERGQRGASGRLGAGIAHDPSSCGR